MAIDYSQCAIPKGRPKALDKDYADAKRDTIDKKESAKARKRAKGQCEVWEEMRTRIKGPASVFRCPLKDAHTHHLLGGIGRRNRGKSILAAYKLRVCARCHRAITANILKPTTAEHDAATVRYWRAK